MLEDPAAMGTSPFMAAPGNSGLPMIGAPGLQPGQMAQPLPNDAPATTAGPSSRVKNR